MRSFEEDLKNKKLDIDNMEVPEELESRLRNSLNSIEGVHYKKSFKDIWLIRHKVIAVLLAVVMFFGIYNYDVFAYYGKKILGYDEVTVGSLKELNELGKGEEINKSYKFKNGAEVTLDGVILDSNKLVAMYTIKGESEDVLNSFIIKDMKGTLGATYSPRGGNGKFSDDKKEIKWIMDFKTPGIFEKNLTFNILCNYKGVSSGEIGRISFKLDRKKAIQQTIKCNINQTIEVQGIKYNFTTFSATPLSVLLEGNIKVSSEEDKKKVVPDIRDASSPRRNLNVELWETYTKDGKTITEKIENKGNGLSSNFSGIKFQDEFDGLKPGNKKLTLKVVKTEVMKMIGRTIDINLQTLNVKVVPDTEELMIKDVKEEDGNTIVTFIGEKDVAFGTALNIDEKQANTLQETSKIVAINGKECLEKTYKFQGCGKKMSLSFKSITHETYIDKQITIFEDK